MIVPSEVLNGRQTYSKLKKSQISMNEYNKQVGKQLQKVREEQGLTIDDVANHLRLSKELIEHIENDCQGKIPSTYFKGYVRGYAKLLAMPDLDLSLSFNDSCSNNFIQGWRLLSSKRQVSASNKYIQWITYGIISTLILLVSLKWKNENLNMSLIDYKDSDQQISVIHSRGK